MKNILGHKSRDQGEIIDILARAGSYTCPTLPHYRYDRVKTVCRTLKRLGLVSVRGQTATAQNFVVTTLFREWEAARKEGATPLGPVKWVKERNRTTIVAQIPEADARRGECGVAR